MAWAKNAGGMAWVDDDGSGNGTLYTASRMNNIEDGIEEARLPPVVTALPASPRDRELVYLQTATMKSNGDYPWLCRYDASLSGNSKWKVVSGEAISITGAGSTTNFSTANLTTYAAITGAPSWTAEIRGSYDLLYATWVQQQQSGPTLSQANVVMALDAVQVSTPKYGAIVTYNQYEGGDIEADIRATINAAQVVTMRGATNNRTFSYGVTGSVLRVKPRFLG